MHSTAAPLLDLTPLLEQLPDLRGRYAAAEPFPHIVLDDVLRRDAFEAVSSEFDGIAASTWTNYLHLNERKFGHTRPDLWGPTLTALRAELASDSFVSFVSELTGIDGLRPDDVMDGGGLHRSFAGGFLNVHADFTAHHTDPTLRRRVNLLLFLNRDWDPAWGGALELWSKDMARCVQSIEPRANRIVVFSTDETAFHGHPERLACPPEVARRSLALYYFRHEADVPLRATRYRTRPGDGVRGIGIHLDSAVLRLYDRAKRRLRAGDGLVSAVTRRLARRRAGSSTR
jgi:hypothetical protein